MPIYKSIVNNSKTILKGEKFLSGKNWFFFQYYFLLTLINVNLEFYLYLFNNINLKYSLNITYWRKAYRSWVTILIQYLYKSYVYFNKLLIIIK